MARMLFELRKLPQGGNLLDFKVKILEEETVEALELAVNAFVQQLKDDNTFTAFFISKTDYDNFSPRIGPDNMHVCVMEYLTVL